MGKFKLLFEKLSIEAIRKYYGYWNKSFYDDWFGAGTYRIYLDAENGRELIDNNVVSSVNTTYDKVISLLAKNGYDIENWESGLAKRIGTSKNFTKIGKLLQKFDIELKKEYDLAKDSSSKLLGKSEDKLLIVISRHPYDIAGMSTDREWKSCMEIDKQTGMEFETISNDIIDYIEDNALIAYLIKDDDKNIQNPLGRILIYPYKNKKEEIYLYPSEKAYGKITSNMRKIVEYWLNKHQKKIKGIVYINKSFYRDDNPLSVYSNIENLREKLLKINLEMDRKIEKNPVQNPDERELSYRSGYSLKSNQMNSILKEKYFLVITQTLINDKDKLIFKVYNYWKPYTLLFSSFNENDLIRKLKELEKR